MSEEAQRKQQVTPHTILKPVYTSASFLYNYYVWKLKYDSQCVFNKGYLTTEEKKGRQWE